MTTRSPSSPTLPAAALLRVLELLRREADERIRRHPQGPLLAGRSEELELRVDLPLSGDLGSAAKAVGGQLDLALDLAIRRLAAARPGRAFCLRCSASGCEHAVPDDPRHVFVGYRANGVPRFEDLGQWLLERGDPRVDLLYREPPGFLALAFSEEELYDGLPDTLQPGPGSARVRGQVVAGWYPIPDASGNTEKLAITLQLLAVGRRVQLHPVGVGPSGESLSSTLDRIAEPPWLDPVRWASSAAATLGGRKQGERKASQSLQRRVDGILSSLVRRLEKLDRGKRRRTRHAESRHAGGRRPTRMAVADLSRAETSSILFDDRRGTAVVLGDRGRTHVFSPRGRLVTSVRYSPEAIERRRERGHWRPATEEEIRALRAGLGSAGARDD